MDVDQEVRIRPAKADDFPSLLPLIDEFAQFVEMEPPGGPARERLLAHGFGERPLYEVLLAEAPGVAEPIGYALFFFTYSSFVGRPTLYLEDLYVRAEHRRKGIGRALFGRCVQVAGERCCGRMEWACLHRDARAQAFYDSLGAHRQDYSFIYRLDQADLQRLDRH